jgi:hypothetical protein
MYIKKRTEPPEGGWEGDQMRRESVMATVAPDFKKELEREAVMQGVTTSVLCRRCLRAGYVLLKDEGSFTEWLEENEADDDKVLFYMASMKLFYVPITEVVETFRERHPELVEDLKEYYIQYVKEL